MFRNVRPAGRIQIERGDRSGFKPAGGCRGVEVAGRVAFECDGVFDVKGTARRRFEAREQLCNVEYLNTDSSLWTEAQVRGKFALSLREDTEELCCVRENNEKICGYFRVEWAGLTRPARHQRRT